MESEALAAEAASAFPHDVRTAFGVDIALGLPLTSSGSTNMSHMTHSGHTHDMQLAHSGWKLKRTASIPSRVLIQDPA